ncbi:MAG: hypothetical protein L0Y43_03905 [Methylococcaceae bacterium]|nr:hypothetical protein [Methylococcaceae bacterium]
MHTEFGKIAHLTQTASKGVSPLRMESVRLSHIIALFALTLGVLDIGAGLDQCGLFLRQGHFGLFHENPLFGFIEHRKQLACLYRIAGIRMQCDQFWSLRSRFWIPP